VPWLNHKSIHPTGRLEIKRQQEAARTILDNNMVAKEHTIMLDTMEK
jgi:hypothetical protein